MVIAESLNFLLWRVVVIEANFKETDVTHIKVGNSATIK